MLEMLEIKGFTKNTLMDWSGKIASILFLPVCNFRCPYCHASELVVDSSAIPNIQVAEIDEYLQANRGWIDGVVITGGEPTLQTNLLQLIDHLREQDLAIKLFTNGSRPAVVRELIETSRLDAIAMDVKAPLDERYNKAAGVEVDTSAIRQSIELIRIPNNRLPESSDP